ncbi:Hypothetical protein CAP_6560 [Chondromyces apiculatus DSM 436]|uniref:Uncharacterized protein n=2 Tax=Chondromyces apiculatus TaxID=51 RepID=A0A017T1E6_9BACT|nr:Hypothetical protein CAP_6560 [Chondromyces apiculatus DSM 436]
MGVGRSVGLGRGAERRLAVVLGAMLGEPAGIAEDVAAFFGQYLRRAPLLAAVGLRLMVWALEWLPVVFVGRPLPASALGPEVLARYLGRWAGARSYLVREGFFLVKMVALLGWGAHPAVRARYGMPGVAVVRAPGGAVVGTAEGAVAGAQQGTEGS